jgi:peroxiredoxin Q/BCP
MSELHGLQTKITEFQEAGATVIAVSPDPVEKNRDVARRFDITYPILSDSDLALTDALGLRHEGAGLESYAPDVPRPATFIIQDGRIVWRDLTDNWRIRIKAEDLLEAFREVTGGA